jgi:riboflavin transporter FmnP
MGKDIFFMSVTQKNRAHLRALVGTAVLAALSSVLMFLEFSVPLVPSFLKMDLSDLPALIASFAYGPIAGVAVALIKNLIHLPMSTTSFAGELANFLLCSCFVLPAGIVYYFVKGKKGAIIGASVGMLLMAAVSLPVNYYITYPVYATFMPLDTILNMYQEINPAVDGLWSALLLFNFPFNLVKGLVSVIITFVIYKKITPLLLGVKS